MVSKTSLRSFLTFVFVGSFFRRFNKIKRPFEGQEEKMRVIVLAMLLVAGISGTGCAAHGFVPGYVGPHPYSGSLGRVMAGNFALTCPGDYYIGSPINACSRQLQYQAGYYAGLGYPVYQNGIQLSDSTKAALWCGAAGVGGMMLVDAVLGRSSGIGRTVGAGLVSAAVCKLWASKRSRPGPEAGRGQETEVQRQPVPPQPQVPQVPNYVFGPATAPKGCQEHGMLKVENRSGIRVELFREGNGGQKGSEIVSLPLPGGQNWVCIGEGRYEAWGEMFYKDSPLQVMGTEYERMVLSRNRVDTMTIHVPTPPGR